jgi:hypothetical protein
MNRWSCYVGKWWKDHPRSNIAHKILRFETETGTLITHCRKSFHESQTMRGIGVLHCPDCIAAEDHHNRMDKRWETTKREK